MRGELVALHRRLGSTMVYVTHDQVEAMTMADRIVVLRDGLVEQAGSPVELYARPNNQFVAGFLGAPQMNFLAGKIADGGADRLTIVVDDERTTLNLSARCRSLPAGAAASLGVRPEHLTLSAEGPLAATVEAVEILGAETIVHARLASGTPITISVRGISGVGPGAAIRLAIDDRFVHVFDDTGLTLQPTRSWSEDYVQHA